jgi:anhydro-N-acetylmuramic acid kinase
MPGAAMSSRNSAQSYIGMMSGTALDGVDALLVELTASGGLPIRTLAHAHQAFDSGLRAALLALNTSGADELHRCALAANEIARAYASAAGKVLAQAGAKPEQVRALGAHGQTVRHRPGEFDGIGYTTQLLNGALLAELTGIDVVCDLRSRDIAAGGQGAPLVPGFHAAVFGRPGLAQAVLNLGGIANLTLLGAGGDVRGFDCGPGIALLDAWCNRHRGARFDDQGAWAAQGIVHAGLLARLESEAYFAKPPPKSTGRDLFNAAWLDRAIAGVPGVSPVDVQSSLAELTARRAAQDLQKHLPGAERLLVCGGGALNSHLMGRLAALLEPLPVQSTAQCGLPPTHVEAAAFAWLAQAHVERRAASRPEVTGGKGARLLGALYPAR